MPEPPSQRSSFLDELKRRKVVRVAIVYGAVAWAVTQVADVALGSFQAPPWVMQAVIVVLVLGFPIAMVMAWAFDVTPEGVKRTPSAQDVASARRYHRGEGATAGSAVEPAPDTDASRSHESASWLSTRAALAAVFLIVIGVGAGWLAGRSAAEERDPDAERSIAVLPFANLAGEDEQYFVDGIHDDILTQLSQLGDLTVISRTSMLRYADTDKTIPEIADELGVGTVLEGSVQKRGNRVRITAQLIDARSDAHLWADNFDETLDDYFAIQSRIATAIASALHATLSPAQATRMKEGATQNAEALDHYLRGIAYMGRWWQGDDLASQEEILDGAVASMDSAVALDPGYAEAWARLAEAHTERVWLGAGGDADRRRAREAIGRAKALQPNLPAVAFAEALYAYHGEDRYEEALDLLARAGRLDPNDARIYRARGWVVRRLGRFEEAIEAFDEALRLDPLGGEGTRTIDSYLHARQYDRVTELARRLDDGRGVLRAWFEVRVSMDRDGDASGAVRVISDPVAAANNGIMGDPVTSVLRTWEIGLDESVLASLADTLVTLLPALASSPITRVYALEFRAWALESLADPAAAGAARALETAYAATLEGELADQARVHLLGGRAINLVRLGEGERAVALADSLAAAFPLARDPWWSGPQAQRARAAVYGRVGRRDEAIDILLPLVPPPSWYTPASLGIDPAFEPLQDHPRWPEVLEAAR